MAAVSSIGSTSFQAFIPSPVTLGATVLGVIGIALAYFFYRQLSYAQLQLTDLRAQLAKPAVEDPRIASLSKKILELEAQLKQLSSEKAQLEESERGLSLENALLKKELHFTEHSRNGFEASFNTAQNDNKKLEKQIKELEAQLNAAKANSGASDRLNANMVALQSQLQKAKDELQAMRTANEQLKNQLATAQTGSTEFSTLKNRLNGEIATLQSDLQKAKDELQKMTTANEQLKAAAQAGSNELATLKTMFAEAYLVVQMLKRLLPAQPLTEDKAALFLDKYKSYQKA